MTTIITVHGTNAGDPSDHGDQWWQNESEFQKRLGELVESEDGDLTFQPFHWSGKNSERERRSAGNRLRKELLKHEAADEPTAVIGHSHGGSVLNHALFSAHAKKKELPLMRAWLTVGTPFIHFTRTQNFLSRVNILGQLAYLAVFTFVIITLGEFWRIYDAAVYLMSGDANQLQSAIELAPRAIVNLAGSLLFLLIIFAFTRRARKRTSKRHQQKFEKTFRERWISLVDKDDEAVSGLRVAKQFNAKIVTFQAIRQTFVSLVVFGSLAALIYGLFSFSRPQNILLERVSSPSAFTSTVDSRLEFDEIQYDHDRGRLFVTYYRSGEGAGIAALQVKDRVYGNSASANAKNNDVYIPFSGAGKSTGPKLNREMTKLIAFCPQTRTVGTWNVESGALERVFQTPNYRSVHDERTSSVNWQISPGGEHLLINTVQGSIELWDINTGTKTATLQKENEIIRFTANGDRFWLRNVDDSRSFYDSKTGQIVFSKTGDFVYVTDKDQAESNFAFIRDDGVLSAVDLKDGQDVFAVELNTTERDANFFSQSLGNIRFDAEQQWATIKGDKRLILADLSQTSTKDPIVVEGGFQWSEIVPNTHFALLSGDDVATSVLDLQTGEIVRTLPGRVQSFSWRGWDAPQIEGAVRQADGGNEVLLVQENGDVASFDLVTGVETARFEAQHQRAGDPKTITLSLFSPDGNGVIIFQDFAFGDDLLVTARDFKSGQMTSVFKPPPGRFLRAVLPILGASAASEADNEAEAASDSLLLVYDDFASIWTPDQKDKSAQNTFDLNLQPLRRNYLEKFDDVGRNVFKDPSAIFSDDGPALWEWPVGLYTGIFVQIEEGLQKSIKRYRQSLERLESRIPLMRKDLERKREWLKNAPAEYGEEEGFDEAFADVVKDVEDAEAYLRRQIEEYETLKANRPLTATFEPLVLNLIGFALFFLVAAFAWLGANIFAVIVLLPATWALNKFVGAQIKNVFFGNDVYGETVNAINDDLAD